MLCYTRHLALGSFLRWLTAGSFSAVTIPGARRHVDDKKPSIVVKSYEHSPHKAFRDRSLRFWDSICELCSSWLQILYVRKAHLVARIVILVPNILTEVAINRGVPLGGCEFGVLPGFRLAISEVQNVWHCVRCCRRQSQVS